jgi:hypothetical protein
MAKIPLSDYRSAAAKCPLCGTEHRAAFDVMQAAPIVVYEVCRNLACGVLFRVTLDDVTTMAVTVERTSV